MKHTGSGRTVCRPTSKYFGIILVFVVIGSLDLYYYQETSWIRNTMMKAHRFTEKTSYNVSPFVNRWNQSGSNSQSVVSLTKKTKGLSKVLINIVKEVLDQSKKPTNLQLSTGNKQLTSTLENIDAFPIVKPKVNSNFAPFNMVNTSFSPSAYVKKLHFSLPSTPEREFFVGDMFYVVFHANDELNNTVTNIGDFYRASIISKKSKSGAVGIITDHQNGTYTAMFRLLWKGKVTIRIQLVLPRQTIDVIERISRERPVDLIKFQKRYTVGQQKVDTPCNVDPVIFKNSAVCNYSDPHAGVWWYCEKPANISCNSSGYHAALRYEGEYLLRTGEEKLFGRGSSALKMPISGHPSKINVNKGGDVLANRRRCVSGLTTPQISGFYQQGVWSSLVCKNRHFSQASEWQQCLQGKTLHFFGDSTIRQWWEHLVRILNLTETDISEAISWTGPLLARSPVHDITVNYRIHGPPYRCQWTRTFLIKYVANAIDEIKGGPNDVVGITMWAHFTSYPVEVYRKRIEAVRAAIERLLHRSPETLVVIKSANTREGGVIIAGDWHAYRLDRVMREVFHGMKVVLVDAWEMTNAQHWHEDAIHPAEDIIVQELEFLCSFVCPL
ncbi:NXPE family member 3-like [Branchiostoma lanceolatum]|uniref:NXPE family member 3-like n=1 Tax=Branchiostoma lanceolatum TaxID=7740 RepID=UPI0034531B7C